MKLLSNVTREMRRIANTHELAVELHGLLKYASSRRPFRAVLASKLRELSVRLAAVPKVKRFNAEQLDQMQPGKLEQETKRAQQICSAIGDELIQAGRGHETASETRQKAKEGDELAKRWAEADDARYALISERKRRETYHGSTKRIRR